ncbi:hypothetical protein [Streptomyces sp. NPDC059651]|uniref:hypothetical protein n=1 Tax=Streptomyces sp. NPDC059651 TaxID=3346897 RepID=UPI00369881D4
MRCLRTGTHAACAGVAGEERLPPNLVAVRAEEATVLTAAERTALEPRSTCHAGGGSPVYQLSGSRDSTDRRTEDSGHPLRVDPVVTWPGATPAAAPPLLEKAGSPYPATWVARHGPPTTVTPSS